MIRENPQSYRYSFKFTLWDYLKSIDKFDIQQIKNLAQITGLLMQANVLPLHFLKIVDFEEENNEVALKQGNVSFSTQPIQLFLFLLFDAIFDPKSLRECQQSAKKPQNQKITDIFSSGLPEKHSDFAKGLSRYLLGKFFK